MPEIILSCYLLTFPKPFLPGISKKQLFCKFTDGEFPTSNFHLTFFFSFFFNFRSKFLFFSKMPHEFTASVCELLCKIDPHALDHQPIVLLSSSFCREQLIL